jgi:hypothetical protein
MKEAEEERRVKETIKGMKFLQAMMLRENYFKELYVKENDTKITSKLDDEGTRKFRSIVSKLNQDEK